MRCWCWTSRIRPRVCATICFSPSLTPSTRATPDRAEMLAWDLTNNLVGKPEGEKIWTNGECSIIAAAILCVVCDNQKRPEFQNMTNVYWFISEMCRTIGNKLPLLEYLKSSRQHTRRGRCYPSPMWPHPAPEAAFTPLPLPPCACLPRNPSTPLPMPVILPLRIWDAKSRRSL